MSTGKLSRSATDQALRYSDESSRLLADMLPVQVWTARPDGALDYVNPCVTAYFGLSATQILDEGWKNVVHPADLPEVGARWAHSLATGEPYHVEFRLLRGQDKLYRWHLGQAQALKDEQGRILRWLGTNTDIDEQKRELEIKAAALDMSLFEKDRLVQIFMQLPVALSIVTGPGYEFSLVNTLWEQVTGKRNVLGKSMYEVFPEFGRQGIFDLVHQVYERGETVETQEFSILIDRGSGELEETFWDGVTQPLRDQQGQIFGLLSCSIEVSDKVRLRRDYEALKT